MNILIIGRGFISKIFQEFYHDFSCISVASRTDMNVEDEESVKNYFSDKSFEVIIWAAGNKNVQLCENNPEIAFLSNAQPLVTISKYSKTARIVYISSDYIFDGSKGNYAESDSPNPQTVYGKSKLKGEENVIENFQSYIIVRTSGVYGRACGWIDWLRKEISSGHKVACFENVFNSPTEGNNLCATINLLLQTPHNLIVNIAGADRVNRFQLYSEACRALGLDSSLLVKTMNTGYFPQDISLNSSLCRYITGVTPLGIKAGMHIINKHYEN